MKTFCTSFLLAALAASSWAAGPGNLTVTLQDGHLQRWDSSWTTKDFQARVWEREGGWMTGSLSLGPWRLGPLHSRQTEALAWSWVVDPQARPGTWGAAWTGDPWAGAWLVQTPEAVMAGVQWLPRWDTFEATLGWQHQWPAESDELRAGAVWRPGDWKFSAAGSQNAQISHRAGQLDADWNDGGFHASVKFPGDSPLAIQVRSRWQDWHGKLALVANAQPDPDAEAGWEPQFGPFDLTVTGLKEGQNWSSVGGAQWRTQEFLVGFVLTGAWTTQLHQVKADLSWSDALGRWEASAQAGVSSRGLLSDGRLVCRWAGPDGSWKAELTLVSPQLLSQWMGSGNTSTLRVECAF